jgi:tetratricopeptide (TPR) repeat protein
VNLLPVLGLIPMGYMRLSWVADHFVYLPMLGLIGLVAGGASVLADRMTQAKRWLLAPLTASAAIILCTLGFASRRYAEIFRDGETFWGYALSQNPQAWIAHHDLAYILASQPGGQTEAIAHYEAALRLRPDYAGAHYNLAVLLARQPGRQAEAAVHFRAALKIDPNFAPAREALQRLQSGR